MYNIKNFLLGKSNAVSSAVLTQSEMSFTTFVSTSSGIHSFLFKGYFFPCRRR